MNPFVNPNKRSILLPPGEVMKALVTLICEILFAGPRLIIVASHDFENRPWTPVRRPTLGRTQSGLVHIGAYPAHITG